MVDETMTLNLTEDQWLAQRLAKKALRLDARPDAPPTAADLRLAMAKIDDPSFVYCKIPAADVRTIHALGQAGFRLVDTLLTLERPLAPPIQSSGGGRFAKPGDRDAVAAVARTSFHFSRFHADPMIAREVANGIKADWAANFFAGQRGDAMIVAEHKNGITGFLQLLYQQQMLIIDLIAVQPHDRRQGVAAAMIAYAQQQHSDFAGMRVGTQAANIAAMRMYEGMGFSLIAAHHVFHYHSPEDSAGKGQP
jgi:ribosomal protein S18 acetylase RimI-like enzyme